MSVPRISSAVVNRSVNACVASELVCSSNCNSFAKNMPTVRATCSNFCQQLVTPSDLISYGIIVGVSVGVSVNCSVRQIKLAFGRTLI